MLALARLTSANQALTDLLITYFFMFDHGLSGHEPVMDSKPCVQKLGMNTALKSALNQ